MKCMPVYEHVYKGQRKISGAPLYHFPHYSLTHYISLNWKLTSFQLTQASSSDSPAFVPHVHSSALVLGLQGNKTRDGNSELHACQQACGLPQGLLSSTEQPLFILHNGECITFDLCDKDISKCLMNSKGNPSAYCDFAVPARSQRRLTCLSQNGVFPERPDTVTCSDKNRSPTY